MNDETTKNDWAELRDEMIEALEEACGVRAGVVLIQGDTGTRILSAGDMTEQLGLIEHARVLLRVQAINRARPDDGQARAFMDAFDAWCAADKPEADAAAYDALLAAREDLRAKGWG